MDYPIHALRDRSTLFIRRNGKKTFVQYFSREFSRDAEAENVYDCTY